MMEAPRHTSAALRGQSGDRYSKSPNPPLQKGGNEEENSFEYHWPSPFSKGGPRGILEVTKTLKNLF